MCAQVNWHTVFWGIAAQWMLAAVILRTSWGLAFFNWIGDVIISFLNHGLAGAEFVFDKDYNKHRLAFIVRCLFSSFQLNHLLKVFSRESDIRQSFLLV
jgi:nucleoside permease NupC